jgi:endonuclease YncB( thermonuclease family)
MRLIIFASLGLFGMSVAASGLTDSANAISKERIKGSVTEVYNGGTITIDGYGSHLRLESISGGIPSAISERALRHSLSSLIEGKKISCQRLNTDNYGTVVARCWNGAGQEITNLLIRQNIARIE